MSFCFKTFSKALILTFGITAVASPGQAKRVYALTAGNQIIGFESENPGALVLLTPAVSGLQAGEVLTAIDYRPANGILMGVSNLQKLYTVSISINGGLPVAVASPVGDGFDGVLTGDKVGMDFNPTVDRIRLTTDEGSNLRVNPNSGELAAQDLNLAPAAGIVEVAYDRNYPGTALTTLFGLDAINNSLVRIGGINGIPSPNGGNVVLVGPVGADFEENGALDFGGTDLLAVLKIGGFSNLVALNPNTGAILQNHGTVFGNPEIIGMAVAPGVMTDVKLSIKRAFNKPQNDSMKFSTLLDIPAGFQVDGAEIHLNIGGVLRAYVLDDKGRAALGHDKVKLKVKSKKGVVEAQQAKFTAKLGGGNYVELEDEGVVNTDTKNASVQLFVSLVYGSEIAQQYVPMEYTAKAGKSGKAKN